MSQPHVNAGPFDRARGVPSIKTIAMIGTGLIATPTAIGRMSPIAWPIDLLSHPGSGTTRAEPMHRPMPLLTITENAGCVRLQLGGLARGEGPSLQDAADDLIRHLLSIVLAFRSSGFRASCEVWPDLETLNLLYELGEIAAGGRDIRSRVFD